MRRHDEVESRYDKQVRLEAISGCCIDAQTSRCMQTLSQQCLVRASMSVGEKKDPPCAHLVQIGVDLALQALAEQRGELCALSSGVWPDTRVSELFDNALSTRATLNRTCTKKLSQNIPRDDERSWTSTVVGSEVFKWSPDAVKWPVSPLDRILRTSGSRVFRFASNKIIRVSPITSVSIRTCNARTSVKKNCVIHSRSA